MHKVSLVFTRQLIRFLSQNFVPVVLGLSLLFLTAGQANAQYGGGGGTGGSGNGTYVPPKGGYSSATGAAIGAGAAAGAGAVFLALHYHGRVTGCVQPGASGLRLLDDKNNKSYTLVPGDVYLRPGQRVQLKGKRSKGDADTQTFTAKKLIKDLGSCDASSAASSGNPASN